MSIGESCTDMIQSFLLEWSLDCSCGSDVTRNIGTSFFVFDYRVVEWSHSLIHHSFPLKSSIK